MKKITLLLFTICLAFTMNAQNIIWEDDFDSYTPTTNVGEVIDVPAGFTNYDVDADTYGWGLTQLSNWSVAQQAELGSMYSGNWIISASFVTNNGVNGNLGIGALEPNNILTLPLVSIPAGAADVDFTFVVGSGSDPTFYEETYDVIVTATNNEGDILAASPELTSTLAFQGSEVRTIDLDAYVGQDIYISFRHYNSSDEFILGLDDLKIEAATLGVNDFELNKITHSFNQETKLLSIESQNTLSNLAVYTILGQEAMRVNLNSTNSEVNLSQLNTGLYIVKINGVNNASKTVKLVIK